MNQFEKYLGLPIRPLWIKSKLNDTFYMKQNPLMYAIIGDICGSRYERAAAHHTKVDPAELSTLMHDDCHYTDDTVHTIAVAAAILNNPENPDFEKFIKEYTRKYPNSGFGPRFCGWVKGLERGDSFGNGAYMRLSPVLWAYYAEDTLAMACASIGCSHNSPQSYMYLPAVINYCKPSQTTYDLTKAFNGYQTKLFYSGDFEKYSISYRFDATCKGSVPEAICAAYHAESYEDAIRNAITLGGDTDTQACIAGYLWGYYMESNGYADAFIPEDLYEWAWNKLPDEFKDILNKFQDFIE